MGKELQRLRRIYCTCDDGSLCAMYNPNELTADCRECCETFCKMWDKLVKFFSEVAKCLMEY
jgi:hypothetical protein